MRVSNVIVLGGGSAGFLAATLLRARLPGLPVTLIRSKDLGIIGVGEGTTTTVPHIIHGRLGVSVDEFFRLAEPQWKLGIRFLWGPRPFFDYVFGFQLDSQYNVLAKRTAHYVKDTPWDFIGFQSAMMSLNKVFLRQPDGSPRISDDEIAYHLENAKLVSFLELMAARLGVEVRDDTVLDVTRNDGGITGLRLASGATAQADLYIDCSGFYSLLLGKTLKEPYRSYRDALFCNKAVVGGWDRSEEPIQPYTTAETMDSGWCWRIDHEHRINRGYVYCDDFISDTDAEAEFRRKNPKVEHTRIVKFKAGRYERAWIGNVVGIGNSAGFVEPLEATSLASICVSCEALAESLAESATDAGVEVPEVIIRAFNRRNGIGMDSIRDFLSLHYRFNTRLKTPFWRECLEKVDLGQMAGHVEYYRENGPSVLYDYTLNLDGDPRQWGMEGYLSMFLGQCVPYQRTYEPTEQERGYWQRIQQGWKKAAEQAFSADEVMRRMRSGDWQWPEGLYREHRGGLSAGSFAVRR